MRPHLTCLQYGSPSAMVRLWYGFSRRGAGEILDLSRPQPGR